ncbi:GNAT family N-acetyltransferase [Mesorhizobium sp. INR15]|uniref:GNAT family N-acetyltransferase n=1 Tax=Mesorhizobium sp. INR15 TaxID=2654248 RepID=UPI0021564806|nr:GNAT family N-acetyltransferase [Mesorhizobium sp. INR15]
MSEAPTAAGQPLGATDRAAVAGGGAYTARLHTSLEAVQPLWLRCQANGVCTAYQCYAWVEGIAQRLMPKGAELLVVEVIDAATGELRMLVPLMRRSRFGHRVIEWLSCGVCDYSAPLLADATPWTSQAAEAAWAAIRSVLPRADRIQITGIPRQISGMDNPLALLAAARDSTQVTSGVVLDGDPETLLKRICKPSFLKNFNKDSRRLERHGTVDLVEANTPTLTELIFGTLVELRLKRFRELGRFDLLAQSAVADFYRNAAIQGLSDGSVRLFGLRVGDAWVAVQYMLARKNTVHTILIAIDQDVVSNAATGLVIIGKLMEWGCRQGFGYFDLSVGSQHYKENIGAGSSLLAKIEETLTPLGKGVFAISALRDRTEAMVRANPRLLQAGQGLVRGLRKLKP